MFVLKVTRNLRVPQSFKLPLQMFDCLFIYLINKYLNDNWFTPEQTIKVVEMQNYKSCKKWIYFKVTNIFSQTPINT